MSAENPRIMERGDVPSNGIESLSTTSVEFSQQKTPRENLRTLVESVTKNGKPLDQDEQAAFMDLIIASDEKGYFKDRANAQMQGLRASIGAMKLQNGMVAFANTDGVFNRGGFRLIGPRMSEANRTFEPVDTEVRKKEAAQVVYAARGLTALADSISAPEKVGGFIRHPNGEFEIGSKLKAGGIKESGRDFYELTKAQRITLTITKLNGTEPELKTAWWNESRNCYEYADTKVKVILRKDHHYLIRGEGAIKPMAQNYNAGLAEKSREYRREKNIKDQEVRSEQSERVLDRAPRFQYLFKHFFDAYYSGMGGVIVNANNKGASTPKDAIKSSELYAPVDLLPGKKYTDIAGQIQLLKNSSKGYEANIQLDGMGTYTVKTSKVDYGDVEVLKNGKPFFTYHAATQEVAAEDFKKFTYFADVAGGTLARTINDYNRNRPRYYAMGQEIGNS